MSLILVRTKIILTFGTKIYPSLNQSRQLQLAFLLKKTKSYWAKTAFNTLTWAGWATRASPPPFDKERAFRMVFSSWMVAPFEASNLAMVALSSRVTGGIGAGKRADPPPKRQKSMLLGNKAPFLPSLYQKTTDPPKRALSRQFFPLCLFPSFAIFLLLLFRWLFYRMTTGDTFLSSD